MKKYALIGLFFSLYIAAGAQELLIVKENSLCLYGLKNSSGDWSAPPRFTEIKPFGNGFYRTFDGLKYGLLDEKGTEILVPTYDELINRSTDLIYAQLGTKCGFLNYKMEVIVPVEYSFYKNVNQQKAILLHKKAGNLVYSTIVDFTGKTLMPLTKGAYLPASRKWWIKESENGEFDELFLVADSVVTYSFSGITVNYGKLGLYDSKGKELLPRIYDEIQYRDEASCWVSLDGKIGAITLTGKTIIAPVFYGEKSSAGSTGVRFPVDNATVIIHDANKHYGLMDKNGEVILPVIHTLVDRVEDGDLLKANLFYLVKQANKLGYANGQGQLVIPANYDTLVPFRFRIKTNNVGYSGFNLHGFIAKCNDEYGVIGLRGDTLVKMHYCEWSYMAEHHIHLFGKDQMLYDVTMVDGFLQLKELKITGSVDQYTFFRINDQVIPFEKVGSEWKVAVYNELTKPTHLYRFGNEDTWYDETGKQFGSYSYLSPLTNQLLLVQTVTDKRGVIRFPEQTFVMDTVYRSLTHSYGVLWATPFEEDAAFCWQPYDMEGKQLTENCFSQVFQIGDTTVAQSTNKTGVVKPDLTWLIPPAYQLIMKFGTSSWLVRGVKGGIGAFDASGKAIADTVYTSIEPVFKRYEQDTTRFFPPGEWWLLKRSSDSILISSTGQKFSTLKERNAILRYLDAAILARQVLFGALNIRFEQETLREIVSQSTYKERLLSAYRKIAENAKYCNAFSLAGHRLYPEENCSDSGGEMLVVAAGKSYYSYAIVTCFTHYSMEEPGDTECDYAYTNNVFYNGRWRELVLSDVVGKGETILKNELQRALKLLDNEQIPCFDPEQLVQSVEGFYLSAEGVRISVRLGGYEQTLLIPTTRLSQIASAKWLVSLLQ